MKFHYYYRTSSDLVLSARQRDLDRSIEIEKEGLAFAALFEAKTLFSTGFAPRFFGITFDPGSNPNNKLWKRAISGPPLYRVRDTAPPGPMVARWHELQKLWDDNLPKAAMEARVSEALTVMGLDEETLRGHSVHFFEVGGYAYAASTTPLTGMTEINATQFLQAQDEAMRKDDTK